MTPNRSVSLVMRFPSRSLIVKVCNLWRSHRVNEVISEDSMTANMTAVSVSGGQTFQPQPTFTSESSVVNVNAPSFFFPSPQRHNCPCHDRGIKDND